MQFKNPEILYFLTLLIIPILVHLFQLQKFVKVPFTNVAFLEKLAQQTRKSSQLKKWLILMTRMLLFTGTIFAFSQPYFSNKKAANKQYTFIYLDNSLSTNTKGEKGNLLQIAAKEIIENTTDKNKYSLQTNSNFYEEISKSELKSKLLNIKNTSKKRDISSVLLKINSSKKNKTNTLSNNILISDFQYTYKNKFTNVTPPLTIIKLNASEKNNISIDSVFISNTNAANFTVNVVVKNQGELKSNIPIAIFNDLKLISKQTFSIEESSHKTVQFTIQNQPTFLGKINIPFTDTYSFDNTFYFRLNTTKKLNVLSIGKEAVFLSKIYTKEEFNFTNTTLRNVNYNALPKQQLIILNELENIPQNLAKSLIEFSNKGGNLVIIPNEDIDIPSYNYFLKNLNFGKIESKKNDSLKITNIRFNHPFFKNVFSKKATNFQYPFVKSHYPILSQNSSTIVSFENGSSFISELINKNKKLYWVASALNKKNSNFLSSPLIVPVFYNFGKLSFKQAKLYYSLQNENNIDIDVKLNKDEVLSISDTKTSFIPIQQQFQNKVTITTTDQPVNAGFYTIRKETDSIQKIAFNFPKEESLLQFLDLNEIKKEHENITISPSIKEAFNEIKKKNKVHWLWKWFLALAIVSLFVEILILKFYKP
jgi:hypothetical protein